MNESGLTSIQRSPEQIRAWLIDRVAEYLERPAAQIDPEISLAEYGFESVYAFALCGDIEDELGLVVEPTLLWDVDTLTALSTRIVELVAEQSR